MVRLFEQKKWSRVPAMVVECVSGGRDGVDDQRDADGMVLVFSRFGRHDNLKVLLWLKTRLNFSYTCYAGVWKPLLC